MSINYRCYFESKMIHLVAFESGLIYRRMICSRKFQKTKKV